MPQHPGALIEHIQHDLGYSTKQLAEHLHMSEVWLYRLIRQHTLPSFHVLNNLITLYLQHATDDTRSTRKLLSRTLLTRCSEVYIEHQRQRIQAKATELFHHSALTAFTQS